MIKKCEFCKKKFETGDRYEKRSPAIRFCSHSCGKKSWVSNNREKVKLSRKKYYQKIKSTNLFKVNRTKWRRNWVSNNKERKAFFDKKYYSENRNHIKEKAMLYFQENKDQIYKRLLLKLKTDKGFRIAYRIRSRLRKSVRIYILKGRVQARKYGVDYRAIIEHLKPFPEDLSKYHIDHIKPLCSFDLTDPEQVKQAFAPENHQWLLAQDNLKKGANI